MTKMGGVKIWGKDQKDLNDLKDIKNTAVVVGLQVP